MAVIDAGSSGSRLHVYSYDVDPSNTPIHIEEIWNRKVTPGLSTLEQEHGSVSAYLEKLFRDAPTAVMPVFVYSTAGMRLLPKTHRNSIYQLISDWFDKQYYWRLDSVRTIPGSEEGIYAWLAINYQLDRLNQSQEQPVGAMDIGGGSVQIIFPIDQETSTQTADTRHLNLYGKQFTLYTKSFLGLGQNEMGHQYFDLNSCYPQGYELPSGALGKGDFEACKQEINILVNNVHYVRKNIEPIISKNEVSNWYIMGGITNLLNDKLFPFSDYQFSLKELKNFSDKNICQQKWSDLEESYPNNYMLFNYCMLSSYVYSLLNHGYTIAPGQMIHFMPQNKTADWTIGVVLQHHKS